MGKFYKKKEFLFFLCYCTCQNMISFEMHILNVEEMINFKRVTDKYFSKKPEVCLRALDRKIILI